MNTNYAKATSYNTECVKLQAGLIMSPPNSSMSVFGRASFSRDPSSRKFYWDGHNTYYAIGTYSILKIISIRKYAANEFQRVVGRMNNYIASIHLYLSTGIYCR